MTRTCEVAPVHHSAKEGHPAAEATGPIMRANQKPTVPGTHSRMSVGAWLAATLALTAVTSTHAQERVAAAEEPAKLEEVVVTGSRIASPNAISTSPVQVLNTADILATGKTDISDILYQLPQILNNDVGQDFSNRTSGLS